MKSKTTEQLRAEYVSLHQSIYVTDCFGLSDLMQLELIEKELKRRGDEISIETNVKTKGTK